MSQNPDLLPPPKADEVQTNILKRFLEDVNNDAARVPESVFKKKILPAFTSDDPGELNISIWIDYAGNMSRPIDVTDKNGAVLFRCPAPMLPPPTTAAGEHRLAVNDILINSMLHSKRHPALGQQYLENEFSDFVNQDPRAIDHLKQWNAIRVRYGLTAIGGNEYLATESKPTEDTQTVEQESTIELADDDEDF